ncbi:MAG TPA: peptidyl-prolyl cis-trans isomerase [Verrucomicrobiales bacterium]|nr:peptidyl-prolyl cis-trans isomerase [Verrucomicrobiales bacterium]
MTAAILCKSTRLTTVRRRALAAFAILAAASVACERRAPENASVIGSVGGRPIDEEVFRKTWARDLPGRASPETRLRVMEELVARTQRLQRARALGLERDPIVVEAYEGLLLARLAEMDLAPRLKAASVDEAEIRARYEEVKDERFRTEGRVRVAVLWYDTRGQVPLEMRYRTKLEEARRRFESQKPVPEPHFGRLAIDHSEHRASRFRGGDVGWLSESEPHTDPWRARIAEIASLLSEPGELSEVVIGAEGAFLVRLMERAPASMRSFDEVCAALRQELLLEKRATVREAYARSLEAVAPAFIDREALQALTGLATKPVSDPDVHTALALEPVSKP